MLARIHTDHAHIATLLALLDNKANRLALGQEVSLPLVRDVIDYLQRYADHSHHPMEDILYQYYLEKQGKGAETVHRLGQEHKVLAESTDQLMDTLNMILNDAVVPRERLIADLRDFAHQQRHHLEQEERYVLPVLEQELTEADWAILQQKVATKLIEDPLFSEGNDQEYEDLRAYLAELEAEAP
ncbi:hemerythrin domain-containing protein [Ferrimonas marina]|uniref:Hemerythrin-like domain-containing protein n=1 Tax=Ferrimonas marina TaxID=299255 RepID=A0A1M5VXH3_9GAMM|nr:hemerythrin domain-containing protein [Ferrimonas marina]SHH79955.1 Hemerythrin-like domain-containing protein [Ferrimonas marina]